MNRFLFYNNNRTGILRIVTRHGSAPTPSHHRSCLVVSLSPLSPTYWNTPYKNRVRRWQIPSIVIAIAIVTVFESLLIANHVHVSFERHARHSHTDISNSSQHYFLFHLFLTQHNMSDEHNTDASATQDVPSYVSNIVAYVDCSVSDGSCSSCPWSAWSCTLTNWVRWTPYAGL